MTLETAGTHNEARVGMARARLVEVIPPPVTLTDFARLGREYAEGRTICSGPGGFWVRSPGETCGCMTCEELDQAAYRDLTGDYLSSTFIVCPDCGNKRCPKAAHHDNVCTGSNEPGQAGGRG